MRTYIHEIKNDEYMSSNTIFNTLGDYKTALKINQLAKIGKSIISVCHLKHYLKSDECCLYQGSIFQIDSFSKDGDVLFAHLRNSWDDDPFLKAPIDHLKSQSLLIDLFFEWCKSEHGYSLFSHSLIDKEIKGNLINISYDGFVMRFFCEENWQVQMDTFDVLKQFKEGTFDLKEIEKKLIL